MGQSPGLIKLIESSLRATALRGKVIAHNIANVETPGFTRSSIKFESALADAMEGKSTFDPQEIMPEIFKPMNTSVNSNGNDVDIEVEIGEMLKNGVKQKVYVRMLRKMYQQMHRAIGANE